MRYDRICYKFHPADRSCPFRWKPSLIELIGDIPFSTDSPCDSSDETFSASTMMSSVFHGLFSSSKTPPHASEETVFPSDHFGLYAEFLLRSPSSDPWLAHLISFTTWSIVLAIVAPSLFYFRRIFLFNFCECIPVKNSEWYLSLSLLDVPIQATQCGHRTSPIFANNKCGGVFD